ncbi:probable phosphatase phospho1 [Chanos chanos]|uniref:Probable phosphatase phospho1 n=1 Tax=Chanos chanos TaxID=29144 RepID=A0A6J2VG93_CHACN|nr:probable phosphatase phospho1 [Chanos chanos]
MRVAFKDHDQFCRVIGPQPRTSSRLILTAQKQPGLSDVFRLPLPSGAKAKRIYSCCLSVKSEIMAAPDTHAPPPRNGRFLMVFDFDETIINENSDDAVVRAAPGQTLPNWLLECYRPGHYNEHMQRILAYMAQQGVQEDAIRTEIECIPASPGLPALLTFLRSRPQDFECVVLSDANMYFIETWLNKAGTRQLFSEVFTNPASFDGDGRLVLLPFHAHGCPRCPDNMCKQVILQDYLARRARERGSPFQRVFYIGDGANDICPTLALGEKDTVFPRRDFPMYRIIQDMQKGQPGTFKASVVPWANGEDVMDCLKRAIEER